LLLCNQRTDVLIDIDMKRRSIAVILGLMLAICGFSQQEEAFKPEAFRINVTEMYPMSYAAQFGLNDFSLTVRNDSAFVLMPYFGEAYVPSFNNTGLNFNQKYRELKVGTTKKKDGIIVTFSVKHGIVDHQFTITAYPNHKAYITVIPSNAQTCSFAGEWSSIGKPTKSLSLR
jgi:hypothetical protein